MEQENNNIMKEEKTQKKGERRSHGCQVSSRQMLIIKQLLAKKLPPTFHAKFMFNKLCTTSRLKYMLHTLPFMSKHFPYSCLTLLLVPYFPTSRILPMSPVAVLGLNLRGALIDRWVWCCSQVVLDPKV